MYHSSPLPITSKNSGLDQLVKPTPVSHPSAYYFLSNSNSKTLQKGNGLTTLTNFNLSVSSSSLPSNSKSITRNADLNAPAKDTLQRSVWNPRVTNSSELPSGLNALYWRLLNGDPPTLAEVAKSIEANAPLIGFKQRGNFNALLKVLGDYLNQIVNDSSVKDLTPKEVAMTIFALRNFHDCKATEQILIHLEIRIVEMFEAIPPLTFATKDLDKLLLSLDKYTSTAAGQKLISAFTHHVFYFPFFSVRTLREAFNLLSNLGSGQIAKDFCDALTKQIEQQEQLPQDEVINIIVSLRECNLPETRNVFVALGNNLATSTQLTTVCLYRILNSLESDINCSRVIPTVLALASHIQQADEFSWFGLKDALSFLPFVESGGAHELESFIVALTKQINASPKMPPWIVHEALDKLQYLPATPSVENFISAVTEKLRLLRHVPPYFIKTISSALTKLTLTPAVESLLFTLAPILLRVPIANTKVIPELIRGMSKFNTTRAVDLVFDALSRRLPNLIMDGDFVSECLCHLSEKSTSAGLERFLIMLVENVDLRIQMTTKQISRAFSGLRGVGLSVGVQILVNYLNTQIKSTSNLFTAEELGEIFLGMQNFASIDSTLSLLPEHFKNVDHFDFLKLQKCIEAFRTSRPSDASEIIISYLREKLPTKSEFSNLSLQQKRVVLGNVVSCLQRHLETSIAAKLLVRDVCLSCEFDQPDERKVLDPISFIAMLLPVTDRTMDLRGASLPLISYFLTGNLTHPSVSSLSFIYDSNNQNVRYTITYLLSSFSLVWDASFLEENKVSLSLKTSEQMTPEQI